MLPPFPGELFLRGIVATFGIYLGICAAGLAFGHLVFFQSLPAQDRFLSQGLLHLRVRELGVVEFLRLGDLADQGGEVEIVDHHFTTYSSKRISETCPLLMVWLTTAAMSAFIFSDSSGVAKKERGEFFR